MFKSAELLKQKVRRYVVPFFAVVVLAAITIVVCAAVAGKVVNIYDGNSVTNFKTSKLTVGEALEEAEIIPGAFDKVEPSLDSAVVANMDIHITRAVPVIVKDGTAQKEVYTLAETVGDFLTEQGIVCGIHDTVTPEVATPIVGGLEIVIRRAKTINYFGDAGNITITTLENTIADMLWHVGISVGVDDFTEPAIDTVLTDGMTVKLVRVEKKVVVNESRIGYQTIERNTDSLTKGNSRVVQKGYNGIRTETYAVVFHDGVEVSKELISSDVTREPVNKIVEKGTAAPKVQPVSTGTKAKGADFSYQKMLVCTATAYDLSYESCGKRPGDANYGITASGMRAGYGVIAVDPSVIPLGTKLYVEAADGSWTYGYCVAGDTGSGIRGNRVDLFFNTSIEAKSFGRRSVNVYVL
ncbi:MAG: G5 domain-containing protein [Clostridia bacterium]|nr:G5 domain-containing protein [Clostridia bacterium]